MTKKEIVEQLVEIRIKSGEYKEEQSYMLTCYYNTFKKKDLKLFLEILKK